MFNLKAQDQGLITLSHQDYLPLMVESFLIDRRSQSLSLDTIELYTKKLQYFLRDCMKSGRVRLENDQIQPNLPDRFEVYRMARDYGILSNAPNGTSTQVGVLANHQCDPVSEPNRMPMADVTERPSAVGNSVQLLLALVA